MELSDMIVWARSFCALHYG